jgi:hypothetical protein
LGLTIAKLTRSEGWIHRSLVSNHRGNAGGLDRREVGYDRVEIKMEDIDGLRNQVQTKKKKKDKDKPR